jgi:uncharacterized protein (TIGR02996 family)
MPTADAFLRSVVADPDADAPRLAYADWLEEAGDAPRAEFIRVQCALAALPDGERELHPLRQREKALLAEHEDEWLRPLLALWGHPRSGWKKWLRSVAATRPKLPPRLKFRRGFVEWLAVDLDAFTDRAAEVRAMTPLQELWAYIDDLDPSGPIARLAACPDAATLRVLGLTFNRLAEGDVRRLIGSPQLTGLRGVCLSGVLDQGGIEALAWAPLGERLERLELSDTGAYTDADVSPLLREPPWPRLRILKLQNVGLPDPAHTALPPFSRFAELRDLDLSRNPLGGDLLLFVLETVPASLTRLDLSAAGLNDLSASALAGWPQLRQLREVSLSRNEITDVGALALADSPNLLAPTRLDLRGNPISRRVQHALRVRLRHQVSV